MWLCSPMACQEWKSSINYQAKIKEPRWCKIRTKRNMWIRPVHTRTRFGMHCNTRTQSGTPSRRPGGGVGVKAASRRASSDALKGLHHLCSALTDAHEHARRIMHVDVLPCWCHGCKTKPNIETTESAASNPDSLTPRCQTIPARLPHKHVYKLHLLPATLPVCCWCWALN
jgi:hypothetical protein